MESFRILLPAILLLANFAGQGSAEQTAYTLPNEFPRCRRSEPGFDHCLKNAVQKALGFLADGYEALDIPPIDPLKIESMDIAQSSGPVRLKLHFENMLMEGLKGSYVETMYSNLEDNKLQTRVRIQQPLVLYGNYTMDGRVLVLPVTGSGWCNLTLTDLVSDTTVLGSRETRDGKEYMKVDFFDFRFDASRLHLNFQNLFKGDKVIGDRTNQFLNDNWREMMREFKPSIEKAFSHAFRDLANIVFQKVPFNQIFLD